MRCTLLVARLGASGDFLLARPVDLGAAQDDVVWLAGGRTRYETVKIRSGQLCWIDT